MAKNEKTSTDIATLAARALRKPGSLSKAEIKSLAGAALTQVADRVKELVAAVTPAAKPAKPSKPAKPKAPAKPKVAPKAKAAAKPKATAKAKPATAKPATAKPAKAKATKPKQG